MNDISKQIEKTITSKIEVRKAKKTAGKGIEIFSWPAFFAGEDYNQELTKNSKVSADNIIDFSEGKNKEKELVENKIKEIANSSANQQLIKQGDFPIIWFKNIDKTTNGSPLQKSLLAIFDPAQNYSLSIGEKTINLSQFILIATSSIADTSKLPNPLFSRLDCINVDTAKPKEFFWDKHFYSILTAAFLTFLVLILMLIYYSDKKDTKSTK